MPSTSGSPRLHKLREDWTTLGAEDPLWAVCVSEHARGGKWDLEAFFELGRTEVSAALAELDRLGLAPGRRRALDFGCGVGRLSAALAEHVDEVIGVDIAPTMLEQARRFDRSGGRCRFVLNTGPDLAFLPDRSVDLVYSSLVLQHMPADLAAGYLREFARVLTDGGVAIFQVADRSTRSLRALIVRLSPWPVLRFLQRRVLGYPAPMRMTLLRRADVERSLAGTGVRIVDRVDDQMYWGPWRYSRYYAVR